MCSLGNKKVDSFGRNVFLWIYDGWVDNHVEIPSLYSVELPMLMVLALE